MAHYDTFRRTMQQSGAFTQPGFFDQAEALSGAYAQQRMGADEAQRGLQATLWNRRHASNLRSVDWQRKQSAKNRKYQFLAALLNASTPALSQIGQQGKPDIGAMAAQNRGYAPIVDEGFYAGLLGAQAMGY